MSIVNLNVLIYINMCFILPNDRQIANEGWLFASLSQNKLMEFFDCLNIFGLKLKKQHIFKNGEKC